MEIITIGLASHQMGTRKKTAYVSGIANDAHCINNKVIIKLTEGVGIIPTGCLHQVSPTRVKLQ
jgi:hypothetical protein